MTHTRPDPTKPDRYLSVVIVFACCPHRQAGAEHITAMLAEHGLSVWVDEGGKGRGITLAEERFAAGDCIYAMKWTFRVATPVDVLLEW